MKSARQPKQLPMLYRTGRYSHHYTLFDLTYQTIKRYNKLLNPSYKLELSPSDIERECRLLAARLPEVKDQEVVAILDREIPLRNFTTGEDEVTTLRGMLPVFSDLTKRYRRTYFQDNYVGTLNTLLVLTLAKEANLKLEKPEES